MHHDRPLLDRVNLSGLILIGAVLGCWQLADRIGLIHLQYVPPPSGVAEGLREIASSGALWSALLHTVMAVLVAWALMMVVGVALGLAIGLSRVISTWTMASVQLLRTLPAIALVPVALLTVGLSIESEILVAAYVGTWPVAISTAVAVQGAHPRLHEVAQCFRLSRRETVQKLLLPAAWPEIVVAARLGMTIALIVVVVTEMIGNPAGLGFMLVRAEQALQPEQMWGYLITTGALGAALQMVLNATARSALPGFAPQLTTGAR